MVLYINCQVAIVSTIASQTSLTSAIFHHIGRRLIWRHPGNSHEHLGRRKDDETCFPRTSCFLPKPKTIIWTYHEKDMEKNSSLWHKTKFFSHHFPLMLHESSTLVPQKLGDPISPQKLHPCDSPKNPHVFFACQHAFLDCLAQFCR